MKKKKALKEIQKGRSMIEMIGVLAIVGILSVGSIGGYMLAMTKLRINRVQEGVVLAAEYLKSYDMVGYSNMEAMVIPEGALDKLASVQRSIDLGYGTTDKPISSYYITISGVPASLCKGLAMKEWASEGVEQIGIIDDVDADPYVFSTPTWLTLDSKISADALSVEQINYIDTKCQSENYKKFRFRFTGYTKNAV